MTPPSIPGAPLRATRHFRYRSLDDLREECARLGLALEFDDDISPLFKSLDIGGRRIDNRFAIHPMEGCDGGLDGSPGELTRRRWLRFAEGGAALLWGEATAVTEEGRANPRQLLIAGHTVSALAALVEETRAAHRNATGGTDALIGLQLTHSGRWSCAAPVLAARLPAIDRRTRVHGAPIGEDYPVISDDALRRLQDAYVEAARRAAEAGFDFIDIKQCHTYLLGELLAARTRPGPYGGSFENRTRFIRELLTRVREGIPDLMLASRINAYDGIPHHADPVDGTGCPDDVALPYLDGFGVDPDEPVRWHPAEPMALVSMLRDHGVSLVNVSMGSPYYNPHIGRPYEKPSEGSYGAPEHPLVGVDRHIRITAALQRAHPDLPMVGTGYSWLQRFLINAAAAAIRSGGAAVAGVGRGALAYPDFVRDARTHGALDARRVCLTVSFCTDLMRSKHDPTGQVPTGCVPRDRLYADIYQTAVCGRDGSPAATSSSTPGRDDAEGGS